MAIATSPAILPPTRVITGEQGQHGTAITLVAPEPSVSGQAVIFTVIVSVQGPSTGAPTAPTGTVDVKDGAMVLCSITLPATTCQYTWSLPGAYNLSATYNGDGNFNTSNSTVAVIHNVAKANTTTTTLDVPDPSVVGEVVVITANVTANAPGAGTPTGQVVVDDGGAYICTITLASGTGTCNYAWPAVGLNPHNLKGVYNGDANFAGSSVSTLHTVNKAATTLTITGDANDPSVVGESYTVKWTIAVKAPGAGTPTGTVTVDDGDGNTCSAAVGAGQCALTSTSPGAKTLTAKYGGDADFKADGDTEPHQVDKADTKTTISFVPEPSVTGQPVVIKVKVAAVAPGAGTPTGTFDVMEVLQRSARSRSLPAVASAATPGLLSVRTRTS